MPLETFQVIHLTGVSKVMYGSCGYQTFYKDAKEWWTEN